MVVLILSIPCLLSLLKLSPLYFRVKERLQEVKPDQVEIFTSNVQKFVKGVLGEFKEYQFFCGECPCHCLLQHCRVLCCVQSTVMISSDF